MSDLWIVRLELRGYGRGRREREEGKEGFVKSEIHNEGRRKIKGHDLFARPRLLAG